jgi:hypothetical protein
VGGAYLVSLLGWGGVEEGGEGGEVMRPVEQGNGCQKGAD